MEESQGPPPAQKKPLEQISWYEIGKLGFRLAFLIGVYQFTTSYAWNFAIDGDAYHPLIQTAKDCRTQFIENPEIRLHPICEKKIGEFVVINYGKLGYPINLTFIPLPDSTPTPK